MSHSRTPGRHTYESIADLFTDQSEDEPVRPTPSSPSTAAQKSGGSEVERRLRGYWQRFSRLHGAVLARLEASDQASDPEAQLEQLASLCDQLEVLREQLEAAWATCERQGLNIPFTAEQYVMMLARFSHPLAVAFLQVKQPDLATVQARTEATRLTFTIDGFEHERVFVQKVHNDSLALLNDQSLEPLQFLVSLPETPAILQWLQKKQRQLR